MNPTTETIRDLAGKLRDGDPLAWNRLQQELQPSLVPIVRRALRNGGGGPALTRFLGKALRTLPEEEGADPADLLARMLCHGLARRLSPDRGAAAVPSAMDTVVDGGGLTDRANRA